MEIIDLCKKFDILQLCANDDNVAHQDVDNVVHQGVDNVVHQGVGGDGGVGRHWAGGAGCTPTPGDLQKNHSWT